MRVLVTGSTGFVGRHVVSQLLKRGHDVIAIARDESKARDFTWFNHVRFIACDIHAASDGLHQKLGQPEAVMHLAWPGLPNYDALFHYEKTLPADYSFLKSLLQSGVGQLLVTGTCFEYGMQSGALAEDLPTAPASPYALAKDTLRKQLQALQRQHAFTLQWARLFYMYGEGQSPGSLLAQLDRAIDNGEPAFNLSGGEQLRDYLPVDEVALRCVTLLEHPQCDGVVNICSGEPISVRRLVERHLANRGANIRLNLGYYPYPAYEPMAFWGDAGRMATILQAS
jgi:dTDP-6-deoxy-L-talose 4-dehydrogenase (NAD+)